MSSGHCKNECSGPKCPYESRRGIGKIDRRLAKLFRFCCKCYIYLRCEDKYCFCCGVQLRINTHDNYRRKVKSELEPILNIEYVSRTAQGHIQGGLQRELRFEGLPHRNILDTIPAQG